MLKAEGWPAIRDADNWRSDSHLFGLQAAKRYVPSMRQRLNLQQLYREALEILPQTMDGQQRSPLPENCPLALDELLRP